MTAVFASDIGSPTWRFYEKNAKGYAEQTAAVDMSALYERFERHLPGGAAILDAGSGSGRDTKHFAEAGYQVTSFDYSAEMAKISTAYTGIPTVVRSFADVNEVNRYDGIWACASLLHLLQTELTDAVARLAKALKPSGVIYMSFRYGVDERCYSDGRCYTDLDEEGVTKIIAAIPPLQVLELWVSGGEGSFEGGGLWLNAIVKKAERQSNVSE